MSMDFREKKLNMRNTANGNFRGQQRGGFDRNGGATSSLKPEIHPN